MARNRFMQIKFIIVCAMLSVAIFSGFSACTVQAADSSIRINQVGYYPAFPKLAVIVADTTIPLKWQLKNSSGVAVLTGQTTVHGNDPASNEPIHIADFSTYKETGSDYVLQINGATSHPFDIGPAAYKKLKYDALAYFYHNRSGIAIELPYAGDTRWTRPAGHAGIAPNKGDTEVPCAPDTGCSYKLDVRGGWYDAGDQGKYVVNGGIAVWTLLNQYERADRLTSTVPFADGRLPIPENKNDVPDLLDEARWEIEFLLRMQVPAKEPKAGMAHHKMHDENWTALPTRPDLDPQQRYLRPPSTAATLNLAAVAAQGSRIWKKLDTTFASRCLSAAESAWKAAVENPEIYADFSDGTGGGSYADSDVSDEFYWAAAELFITTGESIYKDYLQKSPHFKRFRTKLINFVDNGSNTSMTWNTVEALGNISLAVVPNKLPEADITDIRKNIAAAANIYLQAIQTSGYRVPFGNTESYPWGSNSFILNNGIILALAYDFTYQEAYMHGAADALHYVLGRNPMNISYVSGYGTNSMQHPHHRFWANKEEDGFPPPFPGAVSGGPNSALQDPVAGDRLKGCAPQKCFMDHEESYATNEVAINWNAPLAWLCAFLDEEASR